jgi:hypothetical protein
MTKPLSKDFLLSRGYCCGCRCQNCPYIPKHKKHTKETNNVKRPKG